MKRNVEARRRRWPRIGLAITGVCLLAVWAQGQPTTQPTTAPTTAPATALRPPKPSETPPALPETVTRAFVIPIRDDIFPSMADAVKRKLVTIRSRDAELVIFDFNTNGGRVDTADEIAKLIRDELGDVRTVAWVNGKAISAGAWLALTCNEVVMTPRAKIGDCAPIAMGGELKGVQREKIESYISADFRLAAEANGYWPAVMESMVRMNMEVWLVENTSTGERKYVEASEWQDRVTNPPGATTRPAEADGAWRLVKVAVPAGELLTATTKEAQEFGFVKAVVADMDAMQKLYNITEPPQVLSDTWSERVTAFLTSPLVTGLLIMLALFFGYIEINTPGFGVGGIAALCCLAVLFGSRYLTGLAQWWEIALFILGIIFLLVEVFITPGFGVLGISGALMCVIGLLAILIGNPPEKLPIPAEGLEMEGFLDGLFGVAVGFLAGCALCVVVGRYLPKIPIAGRLVLAETPTADSLPADAASPIRRIAPGDRGVTETACRPAGKARFNDDLIDVVTEGAFLAAGTPVVVQRNEGNRLLVEATEPTEREA